MKISMSVVIILTTLCCVLPYIWFVFIAKNEAQKIKKLVKDAIKKENVSFNTKEQWHNNLIGIDETKNLLLFVKMNSQETPFVRIDFSELKSCRINIKSRDFKKEKKWETELQALDLELTFFSEKEAIILNFYDMNDDFTEYYEMKRIEKWQALIQQKINTYSIKKSA
ncbi:MAG: hypothetical protein JJE55_14010 [Flavobacteriaceae bacterium]|nr:hypothetical protein [Flavobacteriaceae bacterium]